MANPLTLSLYVNDERKTVSVPEDTEPLLYVLRNQVGTRGVKYGCGVAQCGACTVVVDGVTKRSCITPLNTVANGAHVKTLEGLGQPNNPRGMQKAFIDNQAAQCAYCTSGIIMGFEQFRPLRSASGRASLPPGMPDGLCWESMRRCNAPTSFPQPFQLLEGGSHAETSDTCRGLVRG